MSKRDELYPWEGERFRRAFDDIFAPDRRSDEKEEQDSERPTETP